MIVSHENFNLIRHESIKMIIEFDRKILTSRLIIKKIILGLKEYYYLVVYDLL